MQSEHPPRRKPRGTPRRRKVALACEPCRERKSRCDGEKPVCAACMRRVLPMARCVYKAENNARSASTDEYVRALHRRIRELEDNLNSDSDLERCSCSDLNNAPGDTIAISDEPSSIGLHTPDTSNAAGRHPTSRTQHADSGPSRTKPDHHPSSSSGSFYRGGITGMGAMITPNDRKHFTSKNAEYFGSSSTASLMCLLTRDPNQHQGRSTLAWASQRIPPPDIIGDSQQVWSGGEQSVHVGDFVLPHRELADHLLECFWERVYCLYPFFDRCSFQQAYENLWTSRGQTSHKLTERNVGLGDKWNSGPNSIVFTCALNAIFALGCQFSDSIPIHEREATTKQFFLRAKRHIGLDLVDIHSIGVVQTLLVVALFLQSTPYPHRCWSSIGMACRLAVGLGLHEEQLEKNKDALELEIHRRTWHGCVMMDVTVSMTYGRPSMTSHLGNVPLPGNFELEASREPTGPSSIAFYICTIRLYSILDRILSDVYKPWQGRYNEKTRPGSLDIIIQLEEQLLQFEPSIPSFLSWTNPCSLTGSNERVLRRQRNVLHSRFVYLQLLLYRPIFIHLCFEAQRDEVKSNSLHSFIFSKCATGCVQAAVDLISLVRETHRTESTDTWWYNGFYTSTSSIILIMSYLCHTVHDIDNPTIDLAWQKAEHILQWMASFSISARNILSHLQAVREKVLANLDTDHPASRPAFQDPSCLYENAPEAQSFGWEGGLLQDELGFLGSFDLSDFQGWFPQVAL